jgi:hypothetical protein
MSNLDKKTVNQLRELVKAKGMAYSGLRKPELIASLQSFDNTTLSNSQQMLDSYGKEIFDTFVNKYRANRVFDNEKNRLYILYKQSKSLHTSDYTDLLGMINLYENMYNTFVNRVDTDRQFREKASTSAEMRDIITGKDWAEAVIELQDLVARFKNDIHENIKAKTNIDYVKSKCSNTGYDMCAYPCVKRPSKVKKDVCIYDN